MKHIKKIIIVAIIAQFTMSFIPNDKWYLFESREFGYRIEFPEKPTPRSQEVNSGIGTLQLNILMLDASKRKGDDNIFYAVNSTEYPSKVIDPITPATLPDFYRNSIDGAVKNVNGKLLSEKIINLKGYSGREVKIDFKDGMAVIKMRFFLVKKMMYTLQTITETKKDFNKSINHFMDSFELLN